MLRALMIPLLLLSSAVVLAGDPAVDSMKADLEARIQIYERVGSLEATTKDLASRVGALERGKDTAPAAPEAKVQPAATVHHPTPHSEVARLLELAKLTPDSKVIDPGCGDARFLIAAVEQYGVKKARGIELDPQQVALARERVKDAGLEDRIEIIEGDARTTDWGDADVAFAYLFSDLLQELTPQLSKMKTIVSYQHQVPGLVMTKDRTAYVWRANQVAATKPAAPETLTVKTIVGVPYAIYMGTKYYGEPNPGCTCSMCQDIRYQLTNRVHIEERQVEKPVIAKAKPAPQPVQQATVYYQPQQMVQYSYCTSGCRSGCSGGNCRKDD